MLNPLDLVLFFMILFIKQFILYTKITWEDMCRVNNEIDGFEECELKLLWNVNITHNVLSWDRTCSTTPGKKTFTIRINVLDVIVKT